MTTGPTPAQVAAQVAMIHRQRPVDRIIGIHTPGGWLGGETLQVHEESCHVAYCSSALQVREALVSLKAPHSNPLLGGECTEEVDPRLPSQGWLAEALLQHVPQGVPTGCQRLAGRRDGLEAPPHAMP
jgi:hypothetical protein